MAVKSGLLKKALKSSLRFSLELLANMLDPGKEKEYEPTPLERTYGEKLPLTGKYFVPDDE